jgi:HAD superfamily 5'-nucleotidase-like hydrolase
MRSIKVIGYDMDYTLVHYRVEHWERRSYAHLRDKLGQRGWPVAGLELDPELVVRGLVVDAELGNLVKANRFGFVKAASHGTRRLGYDELRERYARTIVDLSEPRFVFLNTLFSLSEGCMFAQLVDLLDQGRIGDAALGYHDLYGIVRAQSDAAHMEGELKAEIIADPGRYVEHDEEVVLALLDQHHAGKKLALITNSEWPYTLAMMRHAFDRFLSAGRTWRDLFDLVIVGARKPTFFEQRSPLCEVIDEQGLLRPQVGPLRTGGAYFGGDAQAVERHFGCTGDEILYVGDHLYGDVHVSKSLLRWRTCLVLRELEEEVSAVEGTRGDLERLAELMREKEGLEWRHYQLRLDLQRGRQGYGPRPALDESEITRKMGKLRGRMQALDERIAPLARGAGEVPNRHWGMLMRAGNDKSQLARQVERYADVYTSRVSNFLFATPFCYLRSPRGSLPHDPG